MTMVIIWSLMTIGILAGCIANWYLLIKRFLRPCVPSWIPLLLGILLGVALYLSPYPELRKWWWIAPFVDGGSVPGTATTLVFLAYRRSKNERRRFPNDPRSAARARESDEGSKDK